MENKELQEVEAALKPMKDKSKSFLEVAKGMAVSNDEQVCKVTEILGGIKKFIKAQEDDRKKFTKPLNDVISEINRRYKAINQPVKEADTILRGKLTTYQTIKEGERQEEEKRLRKEQEEKERAEREEKEKKLRKEFPDAPDDTIKDVAGELTPESKDVSVSTTKNYEGGKSKASFRTVWLFDIIDEALVPVAYKMLNLKAIQSAVDCDVRVIPGVKIWSEQKPIIR